MSSEAAEALSEIEREDALEAQDQLIRDIMESIQSQEHSSSSEESD